MASPRDKIGGAFSVKTVSLVLLLLLLSVLASVSAVSFPSPLSLSSSSSSSSSASTEQELLLQQGNYYTLHQTQLLSLHSSETPMQLTLKINVDGKIEWVEGAPSLYSVFREKTVRRLNESNGEGMYTMEAAATRYWICMRENGRLYSVHQQQYHKLQRRKLQKIRHETAKRRTRRRWASPSPQKIFPPSDCLFKTFEFQPEESYERNIGIYSYPHSNLTHGRFLSVSPTSGKGRSYRKAFKNLSQHHPVKITQVPLRYLKQMVNKTLFGRGIEFNSRVRQCLVTLLQCPAPPSRRRQGGGTQKHHPFYAVIQRCKRRADRTEKPPKCRRWGRTAGEAVTSTAFTAGPPTTTLAPPTKPRGSGLARKRPARQRKSLFVP